MSEPMFNSGVPGAGAPQPIEAQEAPSNRKAILAIGGVLAALVVGGGIFFVMSSSSSSTTADSGTVAVPAHSTLAPTSAASKGAVVVEPASVSVSVRDPFAPLYPPLAPSPTTPATPVAPVVVPTTPATVVTTTPVGPVVVPTAPVTTPPTSAPPKTYVLSVSNIDPVGGAAGNGQATFKVNGTTYPKVALTNKFATYFLFYAVNNPQCVSVLFGDVSHTVCEGESLPLTASS
jgi:hypothetical protein